MADARRAVVPTGMAVVRAGLVSDLASLTLLLVALLVVQWPTVAGWGLYARSDTFAFFYPVFFVLHQALRQSSLPLWTSDIFGGFPLFAEGQVGGLYPPGLVAATLATPESGFLALRLFHMALALFGMYAYLRTIRVSCLGSTIGALVFGLGGFVIAQQHHGSLIASAVWLPLLLALVELALRRSDWSTDGLLALAGGLLGMQLLASHVQPVFFTAALVAAYVAWRQGALAWSAFQSGGKCSQRLLGSVGPLMLGLWALVVVAAIGVGIGAVQLLPLFELSRESWRATAWTYQDAVQYSLPPPNLATALFPYFFRSADGGHWSLWQYWEVVLYVGVVPMVLAAIGLASARRGMVGFFGVVAAVSLVLAFGGYLPFGIYEQLWSLPGVQLQRAPARLTYLVTFALGVLAALGAERLAGCEAGQLRRSRRVLFWLQLGVLGLLMVAAGHLVVWRAWLHANPRWALEVLDHWYLGLPRDPGHALSAVRVFEGLDESLDLANPKTWLPLALLAVLAALLLAWRELPRLSAIWRGALALVVAAELVLFAVDFHPIVDRDRLDDLGPAGRFLTAHAGDGRVLLDRAVTTIRSNQLLVKGVADAGGYSPLELDRHRWYGDAVATVPNSLLDLWSVRYLVVPTEVPNLPSYELVAFHPARPLLVGGAQSENGQLALRIGGELATELRSVLALVDGSAIRDGEVVGEWVLTDDSGVRYLLPARAGREVGDWARSHSSVRTLHRPVHVAAEISVADGGSAQPAPRALSYAAQPLSSRARIVRAEYRHAHPVGKTILYGVALYDGPTERASQFFAPEKLVEVYRDTEVIIYENAAAYPRAWVADEGIVASPVEVLPLLAEGPFDGRRQVVLEESFSPVADGRPEAGESAASVTDSSPLHVTVRAAAPNGGFLVLADAYYPGWKALVNGEEVPIARANYVSRAVRLPPGDHDVRFEFDPLRFRVGAFVSTATVLMALALCALSLWGLRLARASSP